MTPEEKAKIAIDELRKQPLAIVSQAFLMQAFNKALEDTKEIPIQHKFTIVKAIVTDGRGVQFEATARVTFVPFKN